MPGRRAARPRIWPYRTPKGAPARLSYAGALKRATADGGIVSGRPSSLETASGDLKFQMPRMVRLPAIGPTPYMSACFGLTRGISGAETVWLPLRLIGSEERPLALCSRASRKKPRPRRSARSRPVGAGEGRGDKPRRRRRAIRCVGLRRARAVHSATRSAAGGWTVLTALTSEPRLASVLNPCHRDLILCSIDLTRCSTDLIPCSIA